MKTELELELLSKNNVILAPDLKNEITLFLANTNLDNLQRHDFFNILEKAYHSGHIEGAWAQ